MSQWQSGSNSLFLLIFLPWELKSAYSKARAKRSLCGNACPFHGNTIGISDLGIDVKVALRDHLDNILEPVICEDTSGLLDLFRHLQFRSVKKQV